MDIFAESKDIRIGERKVRLVADAIRKLSIGQALASLPLIKQRAAIAILKTLQSAIANALNNDL